MIYHSIYMYGFVDIVVFRLFNADKIPLLQYEWLCTLLLFFRHLILQLMWSSNSYTLKTTRIVERMDDTPYNCVIFTIFAQIFLHLESGAVFSPLFFGMNEKFWIFPPFYCFAIVFTPEICINIWWQNYIGRTVWCLQRWNWKIDRYWLYSEMTSKIVFLYVYFYVLLKCSNLSIYAHRFVFNWDCFRIQMHLPTVNLFSLSVRFELIFTFRCKRWNEITRLHRFYPCIQNSEHRNKKLGQKLQSTRFIQPKKKNHRNRKKTVRGIKRTFNTETKWIWYRCELWLLAPNTCRTLLNAYEL